MTSIIVRTTCRNAAEDQPTVSTLMQGMSSAAKVFLVTATESSTHKCSGDREHPSSPLLTAFACPKTSNFDALRQDAAGSLKVAIRLRLLCAYVNML